MKALPAGIRLTAFSGDLQGTVATDKTQLACDDVRKLWLFDLPPGPDPFRPAPRHRVKAPPPSPAAGSSQTAATPPASPSAPAPAAAGPAAESEQHDPRHDAFRDLSDRPFYGLQVVDSPDAVSVELIFANPVALARAVIGSEGNLQRVQAQLAQLDGLYAGRFIFILDSPFDVISTNATRREGHKLTWEIPITDPAAQLQQFLVARLKK